MTNAKPNYNFEESYVNQKQVLVTNNLGRTAEHLELVFLSGYFGEVREFDDIANAATGMININDERQVFTTQIETTDTFVVGQVVYFEPGGSSAAGKLRATPEPTAIAVGIVTQVSAGVAVEFKPFKQRGEVNGLNMAVYEVEADASTPIVITGLVPIGAKIVDVMVEATATSGSGTLQLKSNAGTPAAITSAITCAVDNAVSRTTSLTNDVVDSDGLQVVAAGANDRGIMTIFWR